MSGQGAFVPTISIHALREEGDEINYYGMIAAFISIHALLEEGDIYRWVDWERENIFLSTPSARRATFPAQRDADGRRISIHALREEGDAHAAPADRRQDISIHALREEGDRRLHHDHQRRPEISIHALREEGDAASPRTTSPRSYFYPRPPRGGRHNLDRWIPDDV